ncbi:MAG: hypothetical protein FWB98_07285 [Defluviitaleaceae bacterium]|nr:hypothetical protein [Defluviitaleaceae bacterium]
MKSKSFGQWLLVFTVVILNILIIVYPSVALEAARRGLFLWFNSVLPGVLPFVVGAYVLSALGAVNLFGLALSPVMKRFFRISGRGGFALALGLVSGYPIGAKIVCEMRGRGELGRVEAQRLLGFANNGGPLFILGAVASGMFGSAAFGYLLLITHYIGAVLVGLLMRLYGKRGAEAPQEAPPFIIAGRPKEPFGHILGQAVKNAMETMLLVGGFIVLFSVVSALLGQAGLFALIPFGGDYAPALWSGLIEMTGGLGLASDFGITGGIAALSAFLLGFGGLSIMFQSLSFVGKTDLKGGVYVLCKLAHGAISAIAAFLMFPLFARAMERGQAQTVFAPTITRTFVNSAAAFAVTTAVLIIVCLTILAVGAIKKNPR